MFMPDREVKRYLTRNEKRQQHQQYATLNSAQNPLDGRTTALRQAQKDDAYLADIREAVKDKNTEFLMQNGLLFQWKCHTVNEDPTKLLVLPKNYRNMALWTAHMIPTAGHLGRKKT